MKKADLDRLRRFQSESAGSIEISESALADLLAKMDLLGLIAKDWARLRDICPHCHQAYEATSCDTTHALVKALRAKVAEGD